MNKEVLDNIKTLIETVYDSEACSFTEERSSGNDLDVFSDGFECGQSKLAYQIGVMLNMDLEEPQEPRYSWE